VSQAPAAGVEKGGRPSITCSYAAARTRTSGTTSSVTLLDDTASGLFWAQLIFPSRISLLADGVHDGRAR
jgi:hypothetical protein